MKKRVLSLILALSLVLGLPAGASGLAPAPETPLAAGSYLSAYLTEDGELYTCGHNDGYQLGYEHTNAANHVQNEFVKVMDDVVAVDFGWNQAAAITSDGSLWMWGSTGFGQLGFESSEDYQTTPRKVMDGVAQVSCGGNFTAVVKTDSSLWTFGYGYGGLLGNGQEVGESAQPQHILDDVVQVSCGATCAAAIQTDGSLWTWGNNPSGQLGFETDIQGGGVGARAADQCTPHKILESGAAYIECGNSSMALIKTDGSLWTWGNGPLGDGTRESTSEHQHILDDVVQVSLSMDGSSAYYAIQSDGSLWAWGSNGSGSLGFKSGNVSGQYLQTIPRKLLDGVAAVATGGIHTIALMTDGSLWAWGFDNCGAQGRGSNISICYSPSKVLDNVRSASGAQETTQETAEGAGFTDVSSSDYFAQAVGWAVTNGITQGTGGGAFSPENTVTRAEAVTFLWRSAGEPEPAATASPFTDVTDSSAYYYDAVLWAVEQGITQGVGDGRFNLTGTLTYEQIFTFLCRFAGQSAGGAGWSAAAVNWAQDNGLTDGLAYTAAAPCPRSDVVYCLWKQLGDGGESIGETPEEPPQPSEEQPETPESPEDVPSGQTDQDVAAAVIVNGLLQRRTSIDLSAYGLEASEAEALARDIADLNGENPYGVTGLSASDQTLSVTYESSVSSLWGLSQEVQAAAERVVDQVITDGMSDYDIAKALHDYLVLNCKYDMRLYSGGMPSTAYTPYGALIDGTAVCQGYAEAYQVLLELCNIPCEYVSGYGNGGRHGWNLVQIDGEWYHVDTTWDDPTPDREGYVRYDYFLKSDAYMSRDHSNWTQKQVCSSTKYDNAGLPDSFEQAEREQYNAILDACYAAAQNMPYQTVAALQAATEEELQNARYLYVDFSGLGIDVSILAQYRTEAGRVLTERYPDLTMVSFDRDNLRYQLRRDDVAEEMQRRQAVQEEKQQLQEEQAQQEQDAQAAASAAEVQAALERAIAGMDCYTTTVTLSGYTDEAVELACDNMSTVGYTFDGYTFRTPWADSDYSLSAKSGGVVTITNRKWAAAEEQKYLDQIDAAIDSGELRLTLQGGNYADRPNQPWYYASQAAAAAREEGYTTPGGLTAGTDYTIASSIDSATENLIVRITYPFPAMSDAEALTHFTGIFEDAVRKGLPEVTVQESDGMRDYSDIVQEAYHTVNTDGYEVDGLIAGTDYNIWTKSSGANTATWSIVYYMEE